ncbi:kinase-like domain-containing protein [Parachaetomium inaequale]|uniref:Kinase-like domain-containing protein n=1 Tax=Parachaetomium inaequale TaxID=2588326 RepID=A0AAN6SQD1_9PEZI|nr:kinase-like domain-containing protein [Parachaetomium inaequale]
MGTSHKMPKEITRAEFIAGLERIDDKGIYPKIPADMPVTVALENLDNGVAFTKRGGVRRYETRTELAEKRRKGRQIPRRGNRPKDQLLDEVRILERVPKTPHPYIVRYLGCRICRGRITAIILESLQWTLRDYAHKRRDKFAQLDKEAFLAGLESAVDYIHSLGLAHNDINPYNIMVREADDGSCSPVLIDFDSCGPFRCRLLSSGTPGFADPEDPELFISLKRHDEFALGRLREWWDEEHQVEQIISESSSSESSSSDQN